MAIRNIVIEGDEILRKVSREVTEFDEKLWTFLDDMKETMYKFNGVGLAAVQVGVLKQIFVMDIHDERGYVEFINPVFVERNGEQTSTEGCLSIPGFEGQVLRPSQVIIKAKDRKGNEILLEGEDLFAICVSHEYDHLNGILFRDKVIE